ncbi:ATP-binding protein [Paenibacillus ferrarius]|uniref:ATP-binding protein n=1 Tax=Paenibacillus ferrarius TaxID=1469647 RepID=UPI00117D74BB|nr:ATP-binding protein [Paenibacillus ferrarius]
MEQSKTYFAKAAKLIIAIITINLINCINIVIRAWREGGGDLLLQVADNGAGMDSDRLASVLERYSDG